MKTAKKISILGLAIFFFFLFSPGKSFPLSSIESLKGLKGVEVLIEELNPDLENFNLAMIQIQSDVESKLRKAGVKVLSKGPLHPMMKIRMMEMPPGSQRIIHSATFPPNWSHSGLALQLAPNSAS